MQCPMIVSGPGPRSCRAIRLGCAIAPHHLPKLHDALGRMDLDGLVPLSGCVKRIADLTLRAGVDLRGR